MKGAPLLAPRPAASETSLYRRFPEGWAEARQLPAHCDVMPRRQACLPTGQRSARTKNRRFYDKLAKRVANNELVVIITKGRMDTAPFTR